MPQISLDPRRKLQVIIYENAAIVLERRMCSWLDRRWLRTYRRKSHPVTMTLPAWYPGVSAWKRQVFLFEDGQLRGSVEKEGKAVPSDVVLATVSMSEMRFHSHRACR
ncbi:MAG: hypothetical protein JWM56_1232 [Candidatus Peribacteria bacterium]|nr:hypothetical protein [Candidatus Peribacteria bacterium]